eukprot:Sspe_Gene.30852::Locus_15247_Transcript_1_1_Confidence_1.000_Length_3310::g.30852::m.30852/K14536/RIA1; ribosome assembly protein 1
MSIPRTSPPVSPPAGQRGPVYLPTYDLGQSALAERRDHPEAIRNFCMLAHVDHGKTTLSDHLISSNGVISSALAGKVRYLDCRRDEQEKLITVKASTIALQHTVRGEHHVLNLIDSPGHVDFSCEVSTAVRLSDGALVLVDAIDGVSSQTRAVLQQAYRERVRCCLVINKVDLLITAQGHDPYTAYQIIFQILQEVNAQMALFANVEAIQGAAENPEVTDEGIEEEDEEEEVWFAPSKGNVLFASAVDGWGFTVRDFAKVYSKKLGWSERALEKTLWGEWYLEQKKRKIVRKPPKSDSQPMCVRFIFEQIWKVYHTEQIEDNDARLAQLEKIVNALGLNVRMDLLRRKDAKQGIAMVMAAWLPLSRAACDMVVERLPSPVEAQQYRIPRLVPDLKGVREPALRETLRAGLEGCDPKGPLMAYVAKMLDTDFVPGTALQGGDVEVHQEEGRTDTAFVGVARVFSGTLRKGDKVFVIAPKQDEPVEIPIDQLFILMGRGLAPVDHVPAGNVCGIGGLSQHVLKSASLVSDPNSCGFMQMTFQSAALIRLSIEPVEPSDLPKLRSGLQLLNKSDPQVEVFVTESGEHVLCAAGEVHAERCIRDLQDKYAQIEMRVSEPIVGFRESIVKESKKTTVVAPPGKQCSLTISAEVVPPEVLKVLEEHDDLRLFVDYASDLSLAPQEAWDAARELREAWLGCGKKWARYWGKVWSLGPKQFGTCMLINLAPDITAESVWREMSAKLDEGSSAPTTPPPTDPVPHNDEEDDEVGSSIDGSSSVGGGARRRFFRQLGDSIVSGFQLAADRGPLCDEPMSGVAFVVHEVFMERVQEGPAPTVSGPLSGQMMSAMYQACRNAFMEEGKRLVEPMYECHIVAGNAAHGKVHEVLRRRRGEIIDDYQHDGSLAFTVQAYLPVVESFGLTEELRIKTSGNATPSLHFSHWRKIPEDPFFVPRTEEEKEDLAENDVHLIGNVPRTLINKVRKRKGMLTEEQVVQKAEKMKKYSVRAG